MDADAGIEKRDHLFRGNAGLLSEPYKLLNHPFQQDRVPLIEILELAAICWIVGVCGVAMRNLRAV